MKSLNDAQFSQGTLFAAPKPDDANRWPRGYSPARRSMIEDRTRIAVEPDAQGGFAPRNPKTGEVLYDYGKRRVVDALARSKVAPADLRMDTRGTIGERTNIVVSKPAPPKLGSYTFGSRLIEINGRLGSAQHESEQTLMHEVGHRASHLRGTPHNASRWQGIQQYDGELRFASAAGAEEAFADNYKADTWVPAKNAPKVARFTASGKLSSSYEDPATWNGGSYGLRGNAAIQAHNTYMASRRDLASQFQRNWGEQHYQGRLFGRNANQDVTDKEYDYGQHGYYSDVTEDRKLGSETMGRGVPPEADRWHHGPGGDRWQQTLADSYAMTKAHFGDYPGRVNDAPLGEASWQRQRRAEGMRRLKKERG